MPFPMTEQYLTRSHVGTFVAILCVLNCTASGSAQHPRESLSAVLEPLPIVKIGKSYPHRMMLVNYSSVPISYFSQVTGYAMYSYQELGKSGEWEEKQLAWCALGLRENMLDPGESKVLYFPNIGGNLKFGVSVTNFRDPKHVKTVWSSETG